MPRILGVDLPNDKPTHISLRYIYGIGPALALKLCETANIDPLRRDKELTDDDLTAIDGQRDQLEGKIQERYGLAKDKAKAAVEEWQARQSF